MRRYVPDAFRSTLRNATAAKLFSRYITSKHVDKNWHTTFSSESNFPSLLDREESLKQVSKSREKIPDWNAEGTYNPEEMVLITFTRQEVQDIMSNYVGIVRSNLRLKRAFERL